MRSNRALLAIIFSFTIFILFFLFSFVQVEAKFGITSIEYKINDQKSGSGKIQIHIENEEKKKTLNEISIDLKAAASDVTAKEGDLELATNVTNNELKITFSPPLKPLEVKDIVINYNTADYVKIVGTLTIVTIPQFAQDISPPKMTLRIPKDFGALNFESCNTQLEIEEEDLKLTCDNFSKMLFGDHQTFTYRINKPDTLTSDLDLNLVKPSKGVSVYYKNFLESSPTSTSIDKNNNLTAKFNKSQIAKIDSSVIVYQNQDQEIVKSIQSIYHSFLTEVNEFCKDKLNICTDIYLSSKLNEKLSQIPDLKIETVVGYQYDYFNESKKLHSWIKVSQNDNFVYIDPYMEYKTKFDYLNQIDINRFPIFALSKDPNLQTSSNFLNNNEIPNEFEIVPTNEQITLYPVQDLKFSLNTTSYNQEKKYAIQTTNSSNQIILLRNFTFSSNQIKISDKNEIPVFPGKEVLVPITGEVEEYLKNSDLILTLDIFQSKSWKTQIEPLASYGKLLQTDLINKITIGGYIVIITITIFFTLRLIFTKRENSN